MSPTSPDQALSAEEGYHLPWITYQMSLFWLSMTVAVLCDHLSTLELEVELIWRKKWSFVKVLFLVNRYVPDVMFVYGAVFTAWVSDAQFSELCHSYLRLQVWFSVVPMIALQGILVHRVFCMYSRNRFVLYCLLAGYGAIFISGTVIAAMSMEVVGLPVFLSSSIRTCVPKKIPSYGVANWYLVLAFELGVFLLALAEGVRYIRRAKSVRFLQQPYGVSTSRPFQGPLLRVLLRDSILFPLINLLICLFNLLSTYVWWDAAMFVLIIALASTPTLGCRLILHLRDAYYRPFEEECDQIEPSSELRIEMPNFVLDSATSKGTLSPATTILANGHA